jgi:hypothetical protein
MRLEARYAAWMGVGVARRPVCRQSFDEDVHSRDGDNSW